MRGKPFGFVSTTGATFFVGSAMLGVAPAESLAQSNLVTILSRSVTGSASATATDGSGGNTNGFPLSAMQSPCAGEQQGRNVSSPSNSNGSSGINGSANANCFGFGEACGTPNEYVSVRAQVVVSGNTQPNAMQQYLGGATANSTATSRVVFRIGHTVRFSFSCSTGFQPGGASHASLVGPGIAMSCSGNENMANLVIYLGPGDYTLSTTESAVGNADSFTQNFGSINSGGAQLGNLAAGCHSDFDDGSGTGHPDGGVTIDDLLYYLALFDLGASTADVDDGGGMGVMDGGVTIEDLLYYLARFDAGC